MRFDAYIFDLDGTLLDTLPDLVNLTNMVLEELGMPTRTAEQINSYVGNGARMLLKRAAGEGASDGVLDDMLARWKDLYLEYGHLYTHPYDGIPEVLAELKRRGCKLGVLSNKFDAATQHVIGAHFPGMFDEVRGEGPEIPRKPDPAGLRWMVSQLDVEPARTAYVGDSGTDMTVALAAGTVPVGVTWGYREEAELREKGAVYLVDSPRGLLGIEQLP